MSTSSSHLSNFILHKQLGSGSFGRVFLCSKRSAANADNAPVSPQQQQLYALKKIPLHNLSRQQKQSIVKECHILNALMHPNVVLYYESFLEVLRHNLREQSSHTTTTVTTAHANHLQDNSSVSIQELTDSHTESHEEYLCIVMEYCDGGSCYDILRLLKRINHSSDASNPAATQQSTRTFIPENVLWKWFIQMVWSLKYVHHKRIVHRDVKPMNLLLSTPRSATVPRSDDASAATPHTLKQLYQCDLKLADFGVSRLLDSSNAMAQTLVGTPLYLPPELVEGKMYDSKVDMWAVGCCMYELMQQRHPFEATNQAALVLKIIEAKYDPLPQEHYSEDFINLIYSCLRKDPNERHSCSEILEMDLIRKKAKELGISLDESYENFEIDVSKVSVSKEAKKSAAGPQKSHSNEENYPTEERYRVQKISTRRQQVVKTRDAGAPKTAAGAIRGQRRVRSRRGRVGTSSPIGGSPSYSHCIPPRPVATKKLNFNKISRIRRPASSQRVQSASEQQSSARRKGLSLRSNAGGRRSSVLRRKEIQQVRNLPNDPSSPEPQDPIPTSPTSLPVPLEDPNSDISPSKKEVVEMHVRQPELVRILSSQSVSTAANVDSPQQAPSSVEEKEDSLTVEISVQEDNLLIEEQDTQEETHLDADVTWKVVDEHDDEHTGQTETNESNTTDPDFEKRLEKEQELQHQISSQIGDEKMQEFIQYFTEHPNQSEEKIVQFAFGKISYGQASVVPMCRELVEVRTKDILEHHITQLEKEILSKISEQHYREILSFFLQKRHPTEEDIHRFVFGRIGYEHLDLLHLIRKVGDMRREIELKNVIRED